MIYPVRLRFRRVQGFDLQAHSREVNGLSAIYCARPSDYGNAYRVGIHGTASECVDLYRNHWSQIDTKRYRRALRVLPGRNLACHCDLFDVCHVDVLLDLFGRLECVEVPA